MAVFPPATLVYPPNNATNVPLPVTFKWIPSHAAPTQPYAPQVLFVTLASDVNFNGGLQIPLGADVDSYQVSGLSPGTRCIWKIVTFWDSPESAFSESEVWSFTTGSGPGPTPTPSGNMWPILLIAGAALVALVIMSRQQEEYR